MLPLTLANVGEQNIIKKIGGNVMVINEIAGNVIVNVKEARVAISREMAQKIMV